MAEKIYTPEVIKNNPLPDQEVTYDYSDSQTSTGGIENVATIKEQTVASKRVSHVTVASSLNTHSRKILGEFTFTEGGAIRVGEYTPGVSGDLRISPNGIVARNDSGIITFSLDGTTGDATFKGTINAGTLIGGQVSVGDGNILIDGEQKRMIFYDPDTGLASIIIGNA